ncbi:MAG: hypothetical protein GWN79_16080, partial [Actinobacteria bacterium]|nr:hypothetical protein [Actinomycetota bacterium]NIS33324.1 hypothetical protein [Actinomycetota bacterium]NIT96818.1 hypothetical protein [Actinomycetota bacterium]NIU20498.1 hypothetical protein [Actinomycetota bacterium]NIU68226.1 hypothetical protein [Actinomycetota bacterium]
GMNFALHWRAVRGDRGAYRRDPEWRSLLVMLSIAATIVVGFLWLDDGAALPTALRAGLFNVISLGTSTGFGNATGAESAGDYVHWAAGAQMVVLFLFVVGASTGSTSGGIKVMRLRV